MILLSVLAASALLAVAASAQTLPGRSLQYLPLLDTLLTEMWPELELRSMFAAQIEQETCISVTSKGCWNPRTELKTSREYGFGLGQITIIYNSDGSVKSSTFEEMKKLGGRLAAWKFEDRFDPEMQLRSMILTEKLLYHRIQFGTATDVDRLAFTLSAYNGGIGGVMQDRRLCQKPACDNSRWFGHVAVNSRKAKQPIIGYRTSFYDTNRCYPRYILMDRRPRYAPYLSGKLDRFIDPTARAPTRADGTPNGEACAKALPETGLGRTEVPVRTNSTSPGTGTPRRLAPGTLLP
ncbi:MAG: lytic murein transglycosylase [Gemmatimonadales bacterium]